MNCPVDGEPMIAIEFEHVEMDYCPACEGIWLDSGEIEILFGDADSCRAFMDGGVPKSGGSEKPRRCPICRAKMDKHLTRGEDPVTYERCPQGDGLWLDRGELFGILKSPSPGPDRGRVTQFLREVFPAEIRRGEEEGSQ